MSRIDERVKRAGLVVSLTLPSFLGFDPNISAALLFSFPPVFSMTQCEDERDQYVAQNT